VVPSRDLAAAEVRTGRNSSPAIVNSFGDERRWVPSHGRPGRQDPGLTDAEPSTSARDARVPHHLPDAVGLLHIRTSGTGDGERQNRTPRGVSVHPSEERRDLERHLRGPGAHRARILRTRWLASTTTHGVAIISKPAYLVAVLRGLDKIFMKFYKMTESVSFSDS
jgi:hypothetical protein